MTLGCRCESKIQCCKEQYCTGTWNLMSMNQGELDMVHQEMARVKINILEINELIWMGMGEFNIDDCNVYYCGQESLRRNWVSLSQQKSLKWSTWVQSYKQRNDFGSFLRQIIQHHSNPSLSPNHSCQRSWSWIVLWSPTRSSWTNFPPAKKSPFHHKGLECKRRTQEIPGVTGKFGLGVQNEAGQG